MNEGLIQVLVVAAFIIISIMDGAARKRRKAAQRLGQLPTFEGPPEAADELGQADESSEGSEGMVPEDLWEEIAALARGERPEREAGSVLAPTTPDPGLTREPDSRMEGWTAPEQDVPLETRSADLQGGYSHPHQALTHREHAQVASPAQPLPEELSHEFVPHPPARPRKPQKEPGRARPAESLLAGLRRGSKNSLREAVVLAEVLSPPLTLRDSGWKPLF